MGPDVAIKTAKAAFKLCDRGFRHVGVRRSKVPFDTNSHRKPIDDGHQMPAASLVRRAAGISWPYRPRAPKTEHVVCRPSWPSGPKMAILVA